MLQKLLRVTILLNAASPGFLLLIAGCIALYFVTSSSASSSSFSLKSLLSVLFLCAAPCILTSQTPACRLQIQPMFEDYEYVQDGDVMIGGVVTVNSQIHYMGSGSAPMICLIPLIYYYKDLLSFFFSVDYINEYRNILPNKTLGYHVYDSCADPRKAIKSILQILSGPGQVVPNYSCTQKKVVGFIGDHFSRTTLPIAQLLGIYPYSQISYGATDTLLSDRSLFPSFYRTVSNDNTTYSIICHFLRYLGWTWVGIISSDDDTGDKETSLLTNLLTSHEICVDFVIKAKFQTYSDKNYVDRSREIIKKSSAQILIICGTFSSLMEYFFEQIRNMMHDKTFIINPTFSPHVARVTDYPEIFNLSLSFDVKVERDPEMENYFKSFHPLKNPKDMILKDFWITAFRCSSGNLEKDQMFEKLFKISLHKCNGEGKIEDILQFQSRGNTLQISQAVNTLAISLRSMYTSYGQQSIDTHKIPRSQCSASCLPGEQKVTTSSIHLCCYNCAACAEGEISNISDSENCMKCPEDAWSSENRTFCISKKIEYLSYSEDIISVAFSCLSTSFCILTFFIFAIFVSQRDTPIVRANNKNLSFILLVSIMLSFLCVFLFLGHPVDSTCMLRQICTGLLLSISISSLLAKTITVYIAFKATKPGSVWRTWTGVKLPNCVLLICSSIQVVICMSWVTLCPPFQELDTHSYTEKIIVQCNEGSDLWFYSVLGYMGILAAVSFITAFLSRTLPDSFNEAKYITFSMLVFCSVWIAMIPAYLSTKGKYMVAVEIFAILTSNAGILGCIFVPKCYIILCKPEQNTKSYIMSRTA
ncbi:vomeronasal type-2 receptor 26-like [Anomaloglossus baeobatrachus]|uniref:vomeronasal type-2 receptor 26-like n=1 Tax=Anomaloglossus baeobatrachus TaxID=238106 RepID=UPI003F5000DE